MQIFSREEIYAMSLEAWMALSEAGGSGTLNANRNLVAWHINSSDWLFLVLQFPELGKAQTWQTQNPI